MRRTLALLLPLLLIPVATSASDGDKSRGHHHHVHKVNKAKPSKNSATREYQQAMEKMHHAMMSIPYTGDADIDFVQGMIPHHQGAVDMAKIELKYGDDPKMLWLADYIIRWQEVEIGFMNAWINGRKSAYIMPDADTRHSTIAYKEAMETMHRDMNITYSGDADVDFARGMIPHHQGAIDMAWTLKRDGKQSDLRGLEEDIIRSQRQEIGIMREWLNTQGKN